MIDICKRDELYDRIMYMASFYSGAKLVILR